jgi:hypothetical protein
MIAAPGAALNPERTKPQEDTMSTQPISLYRNTITRAYSMDELGDYWSDRCRDSSGRHYETVCTTPAERQLIPADGVTSYTCGYDGNELCLEHPDGSTTTLHEIIDRNGHIIDPKWGRTERAAH